MSRLKLVRPILAAIVLAVLIGVAATATYRAQHPAPKKRVYPAHALVPNELGAEAAHAQAAMAKIGLVPKLMPLNETGLDASAMHFVIEQSTPPGADATPSAIVTLTTINITAHATPMTIDQGWPRKTHGIIVLASGVNTCLPCHTRGIGVTQCKACHAQTVYESLLPTAPAPPAAKKPASKRKRKK